MSLSLRNTIQHIHKHSFGSDKLQTIIQKSWVLANRGPEDAFEKWIFVNKNEIVVSINNQASPGEWRRLGSTNEFFIGGQPNGRLLQLVFFNEAVLIFKVPVEKLKYMVFVNEYRYHPSQGLAYLNKLRYQDKKVQVIPVSMNEQEVGMEVYDAIGIKYDAKELVGKNIFVNAIPIKDQHLWHVRKDVRYEVKEGKIVRLDFLNIKYTDDGTQLSILSSQRNQISKGDLVFIKEKIFKQGQLKLADKRILVINNDQVVKIQSVFKQRADKLKNKIFGSDK